MTQQSTSERQESQPVIDPRDMMRSAYSRDIARRSVELQRQIKRANHEYTVAKYGRES